jgi:hypothetical protein
VLNKMDSQFHAQLWPNGTAKFNHLTGTSIIAYLLVGRGKCQD